VRVRIVAIMGLFKRGSKQDVPLSGEEWSTNGGSQERASEPAREPEHRPAPGRDREPTPPHAQEPMDSAELERQRDPERVRDDDLHPAGTDAVPTASGTDAVGSRPAPEPERPRVQAPARAPVNPREPEDGDERRLTAQQALAPVRRPGVGKPPGAHIGDESERRARIISFANQKGGVAKTTTTLNLAVAFAESGHEVLAVDLDPQGNLTMSQGIDPDKVDNSMYDVLVDHIPIREVIQEREIDVAVASIDLAGAEIAMSMQIGRERSLEKALAEVVDDYDFVCIDTPPSLGLLTVNALTASDKVIVPVQCEYLSMRGLVQLQNTLEMIRENLNPRVHIEGILPTMLDSRTIHAKEAIEILEENFGQLVFKSRIRKAIKFAEAPVKGSSVLKYDPQGNAAQYYRDLAKEVLTNGAS
jgi:chromosome partitioning protein